MNRTPDLLITNELLYRLSYTGYGENLMYEATRMRDSTRLPCSSSPTMPVMRSVFPSGYDQAHDLFVNWRKLF